MNGGPSIDKMDTINFLLTEVSLGLLGNQFFDINGNSIESLNLLVSKCASKNNQSTASDVPLLKKLKLSESKLSQAEGFTVPKPKSINTQPYTKPDRSRRLSHSDIPADAPPSAEIPAKPQCAKIRLRRSTCIGDRPVWTSTLAQTPPETTPIQSKPTGIRINQSLQAPQPLEKLQRDLNIGKFIRWC